MQLYRELGFRITLKSGRTGLKIVAKPKGAFWGGEILVDAKINEELRKLAFFDLSLWSALSELEFLRKNTNETNFEEKLKELLASGKISEETYSKGMIDGRMSMLEALIKLRRFARNRKVAYVLGGETTPFGAYVHEKLHEVCQKISKISHASREEHDYIEVVVPYILKVLMGEKVELQKFIKKELDWALTTKYLTKDRWPKQIGEIMKLYRKKKITKEDAQSLMRSITYEQLLAAMDNIIKKHS